MKDYNEEYEGYLIACLMLMPRLFDELLLEEKHFLKYGKVLHQAKLLYLKYKTIQVNELTDAQDVASIDKIAEWINSVASVAEFTYYQEKQLEIYKNYKIQTYSRLLETKEIDLQEFTDKISKLSKENITLELSRTEEDIYKLITTDTNYIKFDVFTELGTKVKFIQNTFNIIAARPSVGKSAFALNLISDLSSNYKCLYFNMEMTEKEMYQRLVSLDTGVPIKFFSEPSKNQVKLITDSIHKFVSRKIKIINGSKSLQSMKNIIINEQKEEHLIVFIDYIGYITLSQKLTDRERIGEITRELQMLTKDYNITIFCLAQINREGTSEPTKENLKDSGELEQSAHSILLLHNNSPEPLKAPDPEIKLIVAKNRSGQTGFITMTFHKEIQKFEEDRNINYAKIS